MPESSEETQRRHLRELEGKNIQHYSVLLGAWIGTRMERDRTLVTLSAAAIGLLVTILTTVGLKQLWMVSLYAGAFAGFLWTIRTTIQIYQLNSDMLANELHGSEAPGYKRIDLKPYDRRADVSFLCGTLFAIAIAISSATVSFVTQKESAVSAENTTQTDSSKKHSLQGVETLRPQAPQAEQPAPPPAPPSQPASAPTTPSGTPAKE